MSEDKNTSAGEIIYLMAVAFLYVYVVSFIVDASSFLSEAAKYIKHKNQTHVEAHP